MNRQCKIVRDLLLDMAYAGPDVLEEPAVLDGPDVLDSLAGRVGSDNLRIQGIGLSEVDIAGHVKDCPECRDYANTLANIACLLLTRDRHVFAGSAEDGNAISTKVEGITPDWARLSATIERGIKMRIARERRTVAMFALASAGILAAVWVPLLAWNSQAFLSAQAVGFFGIAIFYLPIHLLRGRRGEKL